MLNATLKSVPEKLVRSEQAGDWTYGPDGQMIATVVEDRFSPESELLVAIHELVECFLCRRNGVTDHEVVEFDNMWVDELKHGHHSNHDEPGDDPRSPYREEHQAATHVERAACSALGLTWEDHCRVISESAPEDRQDQDKNAKGE
jgi:hypothetical protein